MARTGVGSAIQLSTYDGTKNYLLNSGWFHLGSQGSGYDISKTDFRCIELHFCASLITSIFVCIAMNPFDVASTRMYNQKSTVDGKPVLYRNALDCIAKTVRAEGVLALYKGLGAHYLRIGMLVLCLIVTGPHTVLTFIFLEQLKKRLKL
jgi:solute carrier family 25 protein 34/35